MICNLVSFESHLNFVYASYWHDSQIYTNWVPIKETSSSCLLPFFSFSSYNDLSTLLFLVVVIMHLSHQLLEHSSDYLAPVHIASMPSRSTLVSAKSINHVHMLDLVNLALIHHLNTYYPALNPHVPNYSQRTLHPHKTRPAYYW